MGQELAALAPAHDATVAAIADPRQGQPLADTDLTGCEVAIEFSGPEAAFANITHCLRAGLPVVSGSTGWLARFEEVRALVESTGTPFFYASNFSVGVNLFFHFTGQLARQMAVWPTYAPHLTEIHHTHKLDSPSGTALTTAQALLAHTPGLHGWQEVGEGQAAAPGHLPIVALREGEVVGTHIVRYESAVDAIELKHTAHSRAGFADGALRAARWLAEARAAGRTGVFGMNDLLGL